MEATQWKGRVDFGIITIREDEFSAVLKRVPDKIGIAKGRRQYNLRRVETVTGETYVVAVVRCLRPGNAEAQGVARDLLEDLLPQWLLVVGIAGGVPAYEFTLGDVVVSTEVHDFSVEAALNNRFREFALSGGPVPMEAATFAANLPAREEDLAGWNTQESILVGRPKVSLARSRFYGDEEWQRGVREKLEKHFKNKLQRPPLVTAGAIASSDRLIKDAELLQVWLRMARQILAVEMETAGVYQAVRGPHGEIPFLAIRGLSDIVGFKRHPDWTNYACHTAAAFMGALLRMRPIPPRDSKSHAAKRTNPQITVFPSEKQLLATKRQPRGMAERRETPKPPRDRVGVSKPVLAWMHISDLYMGAPAGSLLDLRVATRALLKDVKNCPFKPERIFVTGDVASHGRVEDFNFARHWLEALAEAVSLPGSAFRFVPGNHDVKRVSQWHRIVRRAHKAIREVPEELDGDLENQETRRYLLMQLETYRGFVHDFAREHPKPCANEIDWSEVLAPIPGIRGPVRIAGLSTVWVSDQEDAAGRMVLGKNQLEATLGPAGGDELLLALSHHSPAWLHPTCRGWLGSYAAGQSHVLHSSHGHGEEGAPSISQVEAGMQVFAGRQAESYSYLWGAIRWNPERHWELGWGPRVLQAERGLMRPDDRYALDEDGFIWTGIELSWEPPKPDGPEVPLAGVSGAARSGS